MEDEDLYQLTLEQLHMEYVAAEDAGGGDFTEDLRERVMYLLVNGLPDADRT